MSNLLDKIRQQRNQGKGDPTSSSTSSAGVLTKAHTSTALTPPSPKLAVIDVEELRLRHHRQPTRQDDAGAERERIHQRYQTQGEVAASRAKGRFALLLDATASMDSLIDDARNALRGIFREAKDRAGSKTLEIKVFAFRQYGDSEVVASSPCTGDLAVLTGYLEQVRAWGGDGLSAIEQPMQYVLESGDFDAVILAGDVRSHTAEEVHRKAPAGSRPCDEMARQLGREGKPLYTFVVPTTDAEYTGETIRDFARLAELARGQSAILDGSRAVRDMAVAVVLKHLGGRAAVEQYLLDHGSRMSTGTRQFTQGLLALEHRP